jgi:capsular polysaccharide transport system permease protein
MPSKSAQLNSGSHVVAKQTPWQIQRAVVFGVFIREIQNRFGRYTLGYLWAPLEPLVYLIVLCAIRGKLSGAPIAGLPPAIFFASGLLPFILFRMIPITSLSCVESNMGLFNYQRVKPADIFAARFILECLIILSVAVCLFPLLALIGNPFELNDPLAFFGVCSLFLMFVAGLGLHFTVLGPLWVEAKKVMPLVFRPFFFISGIFFALSSLPPAARPLLTWNPLLHALELIRFYAFKGYVLAPEVSLAFLAACALISFASGLAVYRLVRIKIVTSGTIK